MSDKFLQDLEVMLFILVFIIIFVEILRVGGECKKKQEEEERKIKDKYLEKIKNLYKSKNNPRVDLIIEELKYNKGTMYCTQNLRHLRWRV